MFSALNLPAFPFKIEKKGEEFWLFDEQRKKNILLTPEEWVRQHFIKYLILQKGYPKTLISVEKGLHANELKWRTDIIVYNKEHKPYILVECKASHIPINQQVFDQIAKYNSVHKVKYLVITNGLEHFYYEIDYLNNQFTFLEDLPNY